MIGVAVRGNAGALVEVNSETDFVARNETSRSSSRTSRRSRSTAEGDLDRLLGAKMAGGSSVQETLTNMSPRLAKT